MKLQVHRFLPMTEVEGPGKRACIWVQGCSIHCAGCAVPETWPINGGFSISVEDIANKILCGPKIEGVTFVGGEPFDQAGALAYLGYILKDSGLSIITFTGLTYENIIRNPNIGYTDLLKVTDILIDGPFCKEQIDFTRPWVGSSNQRYHFLTERYKYLEQKMLSVRNKIEIRILPDGRVLFNGLGDIHGLLE